VRPQLNDLAQLLEEEIAVGEELCRNLTAQKQAIVAWDVAELLAQIKAREPWLRLLGELETRRCRLVSDSDLFKETATLRRAMAVLPKESAEKSRLIALRQRTRNTFVQLQADEEHLHLLMENLLSHIQAAFLPVSQPALPTYGENGVAETPRAASTLLCSKA
jgi:flagellar biosynthesis/type III secretory pathway chaperone